MTLSNIRFSKSGNIVADHTYTEFDNGAPSRRVAKTKVLAKPTSMGEYKFCSSSKEGRELALQFAAEKNIKIK